MEPHQPRIEPFIIMTDPFINLAAIQSHPVLLPETFPRSSLQSVKVQHENQMVSEPEYFVPASAFDPSFPTPPDTYQIVDAASLKPRFQKLLPALIEKPVEKKYAKATNIPKFILKVFNNNLPSDMDDKHSKRVHEFLNTLPKAKTRFDLLKLFGRDANREIDRQNRLNRRILKRLLDRNYDNILRNNHIYNKRMYLLFCKKVSLRLSEPAVMDRLEV